MTAYHSRYRSRRLTDGEHYTVIMLMIFGSLLCAVVIGFIAAWMVAEIRHDREKVWSKFSTEEKKPGTSKKIYQCSFMDKNCVDAPPTRPVPKPRPTQKTFRDV